MLEINIHVHLGQCPANQPSGVIKPFTIKIVFRNSKAFFQKVRFWYLI